MIKYENECVCCPANMGCLGSSCPKKNVAYFICDRCDCEVDELYDCDGEQLCEECLLDSFEKVRIDD